MSERDIALFTEITAVRDDKAICTLATTVRNQHGAVCLSGNATTYTAKLR